MADETALLTNAEPGAAGRGEEVLRVENLSVAFGTRGERAALNGVSLSLRSGEVVALVGESGCGKSLTALSIMGLLPPEARIMGGSVRVCGNEIIGTSERQLRRYRGAVMGMVFQDAMVALNPLQAVGRQIDEALRIHTDLGRSERTAKVTALLQAVGVPDPANRLRQLPHQFSGGLRQRIMIAMALIAEPQLIIADEPTTALDVTIQAQILEVLKDITQSRGTAVLFITHDMGVVAEIADRVIVMYGGRVIESAHVVDTFASPAHPYTDALLHSVPRVDSARDVDLPAIPGSVPAPGAAPPGCPFRPRCADATEECHTMPPLAPVLPGHLVACWHPHAGPEDSR
jgi:oligopeptide/dipeptide ABC transporter ATP-binding protein